MEPWIAIALACIAWFCIGVGLTMWWVNREIDRPSDVLIGYWKGTEVWAERDGRFWWRLWLVEGDKRVALQDPRVVGNPMRWPSLNEARNVALRQGMVERFETHR